MLNAFLKLRENNLRKLPIKKKYQKNSKNSFNNEKIDASFRSRTFQATCQQIKKVLEGKYLCTKGLA